MYKTQYFQKFYARAMNARKNNLFNDEKESFTEIKINNIMETTNPFKLFINLKNLKKPFKNKDILTPRNQDIIPNLTKIEIIKQNKVPSMEENRKDIYKLIKNEKLKQKNKVNNYYNNMLIKESQLFRNSLYITQSEHKLFRSNSITNMTNNINNKISAFSQNKTQYKNKNRINDIDNKKENKIKINEITGSTSAEFFKNYLDKKSSYYDTSNILTNDTRMTFFFPHKTKSKYGQNLFYRTAYKTSKNNLIKSFSCSDLSSIRNEISEVICKELKTKNDYCTLGRKMMKFNIILNAQKNILKKIMNKEDYYHYDKIFDKLINLKTKIENTYKSYLNYMDKYLTFLHSKIKENILELNKYDKQIKEIDDDLEIIIVDIVKSQEYLQYLIERRNFLLLIKQRYANPESYYDELFIRDSKILLVGDAICNLKVTKLIKNKSLRIFNNNYLEIQEKIKEKGLNINNIKDYSKKNIDKNQFFQSVDEFIQLYKDSENKNIEYLRNEEIVGKQLIKMKQLYEDEKVMIEKNYPREIEEKENELKKLINKNMLLKRTYEHYEKIILKNSNNTNRNISYKKKKRKISSIEMIILNKYEEEFEKYKYDGFLLLHKLIDLLKNLSYIKYDKSKLISDIFNDHKIKEILKMNLSRFKKEKLSSIYSYIILLISKYEIICKYIINKNDLYLLNTKNRDFIKDKAMELNLIKKKEISKDLKQIIKDKKKYDIKKIIDKSNRITAFIPNKVCPENNVKRYKAMKDMEKKIIINKKQKFLQNEFNSLVHFEDSM